MVSWPGEALLFLLVLTSCGGLAGAIVTGWRTPTLCDASFCKCDAVMSRVSCSCPNGKPKEIILQSNGTEKLPPSTSVIRVDNCFKVTVAENAFSSLVALRHIEIQHVKHLIIQSHAFNWNHKYPGIPSSSGVETGLTMVLNNATLPELPSYAFEGRHTSILLQRLQITVVRSYAFANLDNGISFYQGSQGKLYTYPETHNTERSIQIKDCDIGSVEALAFRRFAAAEILWMGGRVGAFHPRALLDITLVGFDAHTRNAAHRALGKEAGMSGGLRLENLHVGKLESSSMYLSRISSLHILNCTFILFEGGAIRAAVDAPVIRNNQFGKLGSGAFLNLIPDRGLSTEGGPSARTTFLFENNTISKYENASLLVHPAYMLRTESIRLDRACLCSSLWKWALVLVGHVNHEVHKGSTIVHSPHPPPQNAEALFPALLCRPDDGDKYLYFSQMEKKGCSAGFSISEETGIGIVVTVVLVSLGIAILITVVVILCIRRRRKPLNGDRQGKAWIGVPTNQRNRKNRASGAYADEDTSIMQNGLGEPKGREFVVVMPDLKTYRETELHVIVERAEPLVSDENHVRNLDPKSQLLENEDYSDAEKTSL